MEEVQIIRCKAWDETHKEWVTYGFSLRFDFQGNYEVLDAFGSPLRRRKLLPVLWTGKTDKNGKDVYAGDIVRSTVNYTDEHIGVVKFGEHNVFYFDTYGQAAEEAYGYFVQWVTPNSTVTLDAGGGTVDNTTPLDDLVEIIGNVYEHPDLLKAKQ